MLSRLRIGPKLLLAPGAVLVLLLVLACAAYIALARQNDSLESIVGQRAASMRAAAGLGTESHKAHADIYRYLSWIGGSFPPARTEPLRRDILAQHARIAAGLATLSAGALSGAERRHVGQATQAQRSYARAVQDVIELAPLDGSISANAMQKAEAAFALVEQRLAGLGALEDALSRQAASSAKADFRLISILMPALLVLAIALSLAITFAVRRILLGEIRSIGLAASSLASGNFTVQQRDYGSDEIADTSRLLDASIRNLNGMLRTVVDAARTIGAASRDIKLGSLSLGSRAVYRAGALAQTEHALQVLAADVRHGADDARAANRLAAGAGDVAQDGDGIALHLLTMLESNRRSAQQVVAIVDDLERAASATGTLILNAALDASRAPMGAVELGAVATEVRALARRVAGASREIRAVVAESVAQIDGGTAWALQAGSSMQRIASSVRDVEDIVGRLGTAGDGQALQLDGVGQAIVQMDQVTRQNCTLVEEAASAARMLQMQAMALARTVAGFRLEDGEGSAEAPEAPEVPGAALPVAPNEKSGVPGQPTRERRGLNRERRRHPASHLRLASSRK
jgi:methyl-accepting chemotaxis protein